MTEIMPVPRILSFTVLPAESLCRPLFLRGMRSAAAHAPQARTEIGEAPPVADEASRFRGTGTIGAPERAPES